jgi:uncharacterized membrane-anchored protein YhcB (DUF1043 family)
MDSQIRSEINQIILKIPDTQLKPILEFLRQIEKTSMEQLETAELLKKIFNEDAELLKKLAQ